MPRPSPVKPGMKFGRLTALRPTDERLGGHVIWECVCIEGNIVKTTANSLSQGNTTSCGCWRVETSRRTGAIYRHGEARHNAITPMYEIWRSMKKRCDNSNHESYHNYGGRGITYCTTWQTYEVFRDYMLSLPNCPNNILIPGSYLNRTIDRYPDKNGHYKPGNVRWATNKEQVQNSRRYSR